MFSVAKEWNPPQARLREAVGDPGRFDEAIGLCLKLHSIVHCSCVSPAVNTENPTEPAEPQDHTAMTRVPGAPTFLDDIWDGLTREAFETMPTVKDVTIAWNIWHVTRIEDIASNILINDSEQILNGEWLARMNTAVRDTGNAMTDDEIISLSRSLDIDELKNYRDAVGANTAGLLRRLAPADLKRKVNPASVARILAEGGVTEHKDSIWLLDFWGRKNIAGILLMPITRHQIGHLSDSMRLKTKLIKL